MSQTSWTEKIRWQMDRKNKFTYKTIWRSGDDTCCKIHIREHIINFELPERIFWTPVDVREWNIEVKHSNPTKNNTRANSDLRLLRFLRPHASLWIMFVWPINAAWRQNNFKKLSTNIFYYKNKFYLYTNLK